MITTKFELQGKCILMAGGAGSLGKQVIKQLVLVAAGANLDKVTVIQSRTMNCV